ncbi:hypothetical protein [Bacillus sp. SM2101]|uniref:hypothetical protein n=2 Tax=Bacillaceae TaxID=186817 RepID=UPI001BDEFABC|nr:hypothetical protein [Bacillus sp. SM2101]
MKFFYYGFIIINLFFLIAPTITMNKNSEIHNFLERNIIKKQSIVLLASTFLSIVISIIPILFIMIFKNSSIDSNMTTVGILHFLIIWILTNLLAAAIGTTIGSIIKNEWSALISIFIYSFFIWRSLTLDNKAIQKMLNIYDDNLRVMTNNLLGLVFNLQYILDKIFIVLLILMFIILVGLFHNTKRRFIYLCLSLSCIISVVVTTKYLINSEQTFTLEYPTVNDDLYLITSYNMNIDFSEKIKNDMLMNIKIENDIDEIVLLLDQVFKIKEIKMNNSPIDYSFTNNKLVVHTPHKKGERVTLSIKYEGTIFVNNDLGVPSFYVTKNAINLPGNIFYWYPKNSKQEISEFSIKTNTQVSLFSNLTEISSDLYQGKTGSISFFAGQYKKVNKYGVEYIIPISYNFDRFNEHLNNISEQLSSKEYSDAEIAQIQNKNYNRIIVGIWPVYYKYFQLNDDTLLVNYLEL